MTMSVDPTARALSRVGEVLKDKWTLDRLLGVGGMAAVYAATHRNKKRVAVKVLLPELANDPEVRARFVHEGYAANTIEHPGAVSVLDDDVADDGAPFLVMELLEGETLDARWERKGRKLEVIEVLTVTDQLLDVLGAAHTKGIVHRDIKPENLFLTREGKLKILDFGIARILEAARSKNETRAGFVMGTPAFMAPEQAMAKWDEVDGRTDLWAVGATMFTLLTGQHVHEAGTGNEQLIRTATQPARPIGSFSTGLHPAVCALIDRALAFERDLRFPDARSMREAVRAAYAAMKSGAEPGVRVSLTSAAEYAQPARSGGTVGFEQAPVSRMVTRAASSTAIGGTMGAGVTMAMDPAIAVATRGAERDAASAEVARAQPVVTEINQRLAAVRKKAAQMQDAVNAARKELAAEEERFRRATNTRMEGVGEARRDFRRTMMAFASMAYTDTASFDGPDFQALRDDNVKMRLAADARAKEVRVHEVALTSFDAKSVRTGLIVFALGVVLVILLILSPIFIRALTDETGTLSR
jgi:serine/threonine-protein kinase